MLEIDLLCAIIVSLLCALSFIVLYCFSALCFEHFILDCVCFVCSFSGLIGRPVERRLFLPNLFIFVLLHGVVVLSIHVKFLFGTNLL